MEPSCKLLPHGRRVVHLRWKPIHRLARQRTPRAFFL